MTITFSSYVPYLWKPHQPSSCSPSGPQEDGVHMSLPMLITPDPTEESLSHFLFTLWYI
jgi:hypothetical protein